MDSRPVCGRRPSKCRFTEAAVEHLCWRIVFSVTCLLVSAEARASSPVTTTSDFLRALRDPAISQIVLGSGVLNLDTVSASAGGGLVIGPNRQVELVGSVSLLQTADFNSSGWLQTQALQYASGIDFGSNAASLFRLADNTSLGFRDLILWHGLSQLGYDWQVVTLLQPSARASVNFTRTVKVRDGCLPLQIFIQHVTYYVRIGNHTSQQVATLQPFCYVAPQGLTPPLGPAVTGGGVTGDTAANSTASNVTCMADALVIGDLATTITRSNGQSYSLYEQDSAYWCRAYASMSCLSASGPEQCVRDLIVVTTSNSTAAPPSGDSGGENKVTNILLPAVLTGVLTVAFVFATAWCIHRRGKAKRGSSLEALPGGGEDVEGGGGPRGVGARFGSALARLLPLGGVHHGRPHVPGYIPVVSKEALDRIAKVRAELSSKMVAASSTDDLSDVRHLHLVGKGTFGRVYKGEWKGVTVALKVISVPVSQYGQVQWQQVLGEAAIATLLNHPCVLHTYSIALLEYSPARKPISNASDDFGPNAGNDKSAEAAGVQQTPESGTQLEEMSPFYQLKMVSEFCEGGSIVNALNHMNFYDTSGRGMVRLPAIVDIASQVASGMAYLHSANIVHADLKAANVLLKQQPGSGRLQAKVADFGLSFRLDEPEATHVTKGQLGSITHMAPEVLLHGRVSKSSDVYSFGILLYELYTGQQAYWDVPQPMLAYHVATTGGRPQLPQYCPAAYRGLAKACWASEPAARPTFKEIYESLQGLAGDAQKSVGGLKAPATTSATNGELPSVLLEATGVVGLGDMGPLSSGFPATAIQGDGRMAPPPSKESAAATAAGGASTHIASALVPATACANLGVADATADSVNYCREASRVAPAAASSLDGTTSTVVGLASLPVAAHHPISAEGRAT